MWEPAKVLVASHAAAPLGKLKAVYKYSCDQLAHVALHPPAVAAQGIHCLCGHGHAGLLGASMVSWTWRGAAGRGRPEKKTRSYWPETELL